LVRFQKTIGPEEGGNISGKKGNDFKGAYENWCPGGKIKFYSMLFNSRWFYSDC